MSLENFMSLSNLAYLANLSILNSFADRTACQDEVAWVSKILIKIIGELAKASNINDPLRYAKHIVFLLNTNLPLSKNPVKKLAIISKKNQASINISKQSKVPVVSTLKDITKGMQSDIVKSKKNEIPSIDDLIRESG